MTPTAIELAGHGLDRAGIALAQLQRLAENVVVPEVRNAVNTFVEQGTRLVDQAERAVDLAEATAAHFGVEIPERKPQDPPSG